MQSRTRDSRKKIKCHGQFEMIELTANLFFIVVALLPKKPSII